MLASMVDSQLFYRTPPQIFFFLQLYQIRSFKRESDGFFIFLVNKTKELVTLGIILDWGLIAWKRQEY